MNNLHLHLPPDYLIYACLAATHFVLCRLSPEIARRSLNLLISIDQLCWVLITLGNGSPDETISAALWRMERQGKLAGHAFRPVVDALFAPLEKDHCRKAYEAERRGYQLPKEYQQ